jgi:hypothetical protein
MLMQPGADIRNTLLLKAYTTLDALHRGKGTRMVFAALGQQMIICDELCTAGFASDSRRVVREAHAALVRADWDARSSEVWSLAGEDYEAVCAAMQVYETQLRTASPNEARQAEMGMLRMQLGGTVPRQAA